MKNLLFCFVLSIVFLGVTAADAADAKREVVAAFLIANGVDPEQAHRVMADPRITDQPDIIIKNLFFSSPKGTAQKPDVMKISPRLIDQARVFMAENASRLCAVEKRFGTSPAVITSILLIESRLGTYKMAYNVAQAYANLAFLLDPVYFKEIQTRYVKDYPQWAEEATINRARRKARWAAGELVYLLHLADHLNIDPLDLAGSFAGAMGPGQFIPSSFWIFGMDADGDGQASPFNLMDATFSMGHYLKKYGWRENASLEEKRKAIWHYNRSDVYVNTVMMIYEKLRKEESR
jgi:membrane-bound lytic murein transglycosylase B